ncbi:hypothetical protein [Paenirhodobacter populi]|uniref:Uncharacterized protein n=1 Tax=Paenirhodobacter populi TaxID=2306993 RepID=A0A443JRI0_9RHOB|nr:hypothetical protein [Sinirhodobacter populi]RWR23108.1 hypothetical protein D2T30_05670 [Sinirhodobacter populi]
MTAQIRSTALAHAQVAPFEITLPFVCTTCHDEIRSTRRPVNCAGCHGDDFTLSRSPASELTFVADPGHGWLLIAAERYRAYGLNPTRISSCSHVSPDGSVFALEEDGDAEIFLQAFRDYHGITPFIAEQFEDPCRIRNWPLIRTAQPWPGFFPLSVRSMHNQTAVNRILTSGDKGRVIRKQE